MWLVWLLSSYYVLSLMLWGILMWLTTKRVEMYVSVPWVYLKVIAIPFAGFWFFVVLFLDDLRVYLENEDML